ncbi:serine hydrolase domain-containing protein [Microbispora sp. NPDC046933]|uniref:serine hydrolase domain-containing protein n=1 Tax=Microbispora sp. NPDC046933 TaxID=3155618 RepID=UPI0033ECA0F5
MNGRFRAGSVTKSFTATVVLQLVGEGKLRLSDSVEQWLPGLVDKGADITIRHLLQHTSGLREYSTGMMDEAGIPRSELVERAEKLSRDFPPAFPGPLRRCTARTPPRTCRSAGAARSSLLTSRGSIPRWPVRRRHQAIARRCHCQRCRGVRARTEHG